MHAQHPMLVSGDVQKCAALVVFKQDSGNLDAGEQGYCSAGPGRCREDVAGLAQQARLRANPVQVDLNTGAPDAHGCE